MSWSRWLAAAAVLLLASAPSAAAVFLVNATGDAVDVAPGNGICASAQGDCSVRAAVIEANARPGLDHIEIPAGAYQLTISGLAEDQSYTGDLDVTDDLEIRGTGARPDDVVLKGAPMEPSDVGRVLHVHAAASLTVRWLTISDTWAGYDDEGAGAAIRLDGFSLTVEDALIARNNGYSMFPGGGAIYASAGYVAIRRSRFWNNRSDNAAGDGGAIQATGAGLLVEDTEFLGNFADDGGAIESTSLLARRSSFIGNAVSDNYGAVNSGNCMIDASHFEMNWAGTSGTVGCDEIENTTIRNNTADETIVWAGILRNSAVVGNFASGPVVSAGAVFNSTISGNQAGDWVIQAPLVQFSTIVDNSLPDVGNRVLMGGRVFASIIGRNFVVGGGLIACDGQFGFASDGLNVIDVSDGCALAASDLAGTQASPLDVGVALPALNGGETPTHALLPLSPALDLVPSSACFIDSDGNPISGGLDPLTSDQRGAIRPNGAACDAGAYEAGIACSDGIDNDGDARADYPFDKGCASSADDDEHGTRACDDGVGNDGDGWIDYQIAAGTGDPGCAAHTQRFEDPQCQDGVDNDLATGIDFDGGASANGGVTLDVADPQCTAPHAASEAPPAPGCGIGPELALLVPLLSSLRRRSVAGARS